MDEMTLNVRTAAVCAGGLSRRYGATRALDQVSLTLNRGITGLLGPNGAGNTTLLSILATVNEPDTGQVSVFGLDPRDAAERLEIRRRLGYLPQELGYHRNRSRCSGSSPAGSADPGRADVRAGPRAAAAVP